MLHENMVNVYVSTTSFIDKDLNSIFELCKLYDLPGIELSKVTDFSYDTLLKGLNVFQFLVHNYFPPPPVPFLLNLTSQDESILAQSRDLCYRAIDLSQELGGNLYAAHAGFGIDIPPSILGNPVEQAQFIEKHGISTHNVYEKLVESTLLLCDYGQSRGVKFLIENHVLSVNNGSVGKSLLPMVDSQDLLQLAIDVNHPNFGILVDMGHLNVSANTLGLNRHKFIDDIAPFIGAFHLSGNNGVHDSHEMFDNSAWFIQRLKDFPDVAITIELDSAPIDSIRRTFELVKGAL